MDGQQSKELAIQSAKRAAQFEQELSPGGCGRNSHSHLALQFSRDVIQWDSPLHVPLNRNWAGPVSSFAKDLVTFEEVAVYFSPEEWEWLSDWQKELYRDVMRGNFEMLVSLAPDLEAQKPGVIARIEHGEEPCRAGEPPFPKARAGGRRGCLDGQVLVKKESHPDEHLEGLPGHVAHLEASEGGLDNSAASVLPTWPLGAAAAAPPWPTELQWPSCSLAGQEGAPIAFQVGHPCASGGGFWPAGVSTPPPDGHEEMLLICTQCQKCFPAPPARSAPAAAPTGEVTQVCPGCRRRSTAVAPPQSHTGAQPCACPACLSLRFRQRVPREERPFRCGKCEKSFRYVHEYTWHQKVHSGEKNYRCGACEKVFRHKQELMWHQRTHTAEWPHKCGACEKSFRFKQELTWHLKTHSVERPYKCAECGKSFRFKQEFMWHQRAHVGDRPYKCGECEKSFRFKQEYTWHQRSHAGEKSYKCPGCDKSFRYKQEYTWHQRIHTGEQPYPCASCDSTFTCRQEYMRHQRLHDGEKPYQCPHCEKTFRRGSTLIRHRRIHAGEGPFKCSHCDRTFGQSANLIKHQRTHALKKEPVESAPAWPPCLQAAPQPAPLGMLSLKTVSVGALLLLNLQEPKQESDPAGTAEAWVPQM